MPEHDPSAWDRYCHGSACCGWAPGTSRSDRVRRIGPFEIVRRLESGGMGTLVLARRVGPSGFSRELALKLIHPHLAEEPSFLEMFVREAKLVARIQHPNVVHVEELGQDDGTWFIAMEYVRGGSLANLLTAVGKRGRKLEPSVAVHIACAVADGLRRGARARRRRARQRRPAWCTAT
jgi:serine/threonine protein kinase